MTPKIHPLVFAETFWPDVTFYREQVEVIESVDQDAETFVVAGNQLGKDYVAGFIVVCMFLRAMKEGATCRIVTTSVRDDHLRVLWGEISRLLEKCKYPLDEKKGGPLIINHRDIRRAKDGKDGYSYLRGMTSKMGEGMAGHHADWTLAVIDESSGVSNNVYDMVLGWAKRVLVFGNPNPCDMDHFFRKGVEGGDLVATK